MERQLPIILASHGPFAQGALECAQMLMGQQQDIEVITVFVDSNIDLLRQQMAESYQRLNKGDGVIILVDLMGGTPCNLAGELLIQHGNVLLFSGFNIPVLLEVLNHRAGSLNDVKSAIEEVFSQSCVDVAQVLNSQREQFADL
ncbi:PTS sugar transporter subunit IIA [Gilliamella sp. B2776]|uniref:PTS sugar transporter subunit IIA n=1 Tax=unclassified Gilliamella TaxID=2685620 RepID=UPI00226AE6E1|nr:MULTISPECIES: PTS sugar transporter subunit IIA [unclassified Gilliamella]MCX8649654.1 PTS sugar transporter subunit IIA [Gilliamella sp. B2779]MCX8654828.1 PTS sugar transporter subunit IIA [Gilliamella sp. B2737]MCX8656958.1 PTS sugar transporter subunit IIA [Gilliamella sp. B2894]MCX8665040.1 PTS sugar transporter subunit IIA [Gilliamella sp. B2887]MCX8691356.1 PTS sugar transporter subunit IIA [Gilliamella sp. B2776]